MTNLMKMRMEYNNLRKIGYSHGDARIEIKCRLALGLLRNDSSIPDEELIESSKEKEKSATILKFPSK